MPYGMSLPDYGAREERNHLIGKRSAEWDKFLNLAFEKTGDEEFIWLAKNPIPTDELHSGGFDWHKNRVRYHIKCEHLIQDHHDRLTLDEWLVFYEIFPFFCVIEGILKHFHFDVPMLKKWKLYPREDSSGYRDYILKLQPHLRRELPLEEQAKFICSSPCGYAVAIFVGKRQTGDIQQVFLDLVTEIVEGNMGTTNIEYLASEPFKFFFGKSVEGFGLTSGAVPHLCRIEDRVRNTKSFSVLDRVLSAIYLLCRSEKHDTAAQAHIKRIEEAHRTRYAELLNAARKRLAQDPDYARVKAADDEGWN